MVKAPDTLLLVSLSPACVIVVTKVVIKWFIVGLWLQFSDWSRYRGLICTGLRIMHFKHERKSSCSSCEKEGLQSISQQPLAQTTLGEKKKKKTTTQMTSKTLNSTASGVVVVEGQNQLLCSSS